MDKKLELVAKTNKMKPSEVIMASTCVDEVRDFGDEIAEALDPMVKLFKKIGDGDSGDSDELEYELFEVCRFISFMLYSRDGGPFDFEFREFVMDMGEGSTEKQFKAWFNKFTK